MATEEYTIFTAFPLDQLEEVKQKVGDEYKVVHLVRHAQGAWRPRAAWWAGEGVPAFGRWAAPRRGWRRAAGGGRCTPFC